MGHLKTAVGGFVAGAGIMYFADPNRGKRRRALTRDMAVAGWHDVSNEVNKAGRDVSNRTRGVASSLRWSRRGQPDGAVLLGRIRSRIGRAVSHPHAIRATVEENGRVVLEGPVLQHEVDYLLRTIRHVPGVTEVVSRLEAHEEPGGISSLQGGYPRAEYSEWMQENWTPGLRIAAGALAAANFYSSLRSRSPLRWAGALAGGALLVRAVANRPLRRLMGLDDGCVVDFDKTVHINAPVENVFAFWSNLENFPRFMTHLKEVRDLGNGRSHWVAAGPGGLSIPWEAEMTRRSENKLLAWKSVPGSLVRSTGTVRFDPDREGTRVTVRMSYCPPAGIFGHAVAWLFNADPKHEIDDDMIRLKSLIETGKTRAHGASVRREDVRLGAGGYPAGFGEHERTITVHVGPEEAFRYLSSVSNLLEFLPHIKSVRQEENGHLFGVMDLEGRQYEMSGYFRADVANRRLDWGSDGTPDYRGWLEIKPAGPEESRIRVHLSMKSAAAETPPPHAGLAGDRVERTLDSVLNTLREKLERQATVSQTNP